MNKAVQDKEILKQLIDLALHFVDTIDDILIDKQYFEEMTDPISVIDMLTAIRHSLDNHNSIVQVYNTDDYEMESMLTALAEYCDDYYYGEDTL